MRLTRKGVKVDHYKKAGKSLTSYVRLESSVDNTITQTAFTMPRLTVLSMKQMKGTTQVIHVLVESTVF